MDRKIITTALIFAVSSTSFAGSWDGNGTNSDPYMISEVQHLIELSEEVNNGNSFYNTCFALTNDIDLSEICNKEKGNWVPIGSPVQYFEGTLLGNYHTISNLYLIGNTGLSYFGLFGYVGDNGIIDGVILDNCLLNVTAWIGGIAGANNGRITNCTIRSGSIESWEFAGGIVGANFNLVANCQNYGTVNSAKCSGGICGYNYGSVIRCDNYGYITSYEGGGGIVGFNGGFKESDNCFDVRMGYINYCHNGGDVGGTKKIGGIAGRNDGFLINSNNVSEVTGDMGTGGLVGYNGGFDGVTGHISNSYNIGRVISNSTDVGGITGYNNTSGEVYNTYSTENIVSFEQETDHRLGTNLGNEMNCFIINDSTDLYKLKDTLNLWISQSMNNEYSLWLSGDSLYLTLGEYTPTRIEKSISFHQRLTIINGHDCIYLSSSEPIRTKIFTIDGKYVRDVQIKPYIILQVTLKKGVYVIDNQKAIIF